MRATWLAHDLEDEAPFASFGRRIQGTGEEHIVPGSQEVRGNFLEGEGDDGRRSDGDVAFQDFVDPSQ